MDVPEAWFAVRCLFRLDAQEPATYEERITLWRAASPEEAVALAEEEAVEYGAEYLGLAQAYSMVDQPVHGAELFSLLRDSHLQPEAYLDAFFDTGEEYQGTIG